MDRRVHIAGLRMMRRLLNSPQLSPFLEGETLPGKDVQSDDVFLDFARNNGVTTYHLIGTAKMGPADDPMAVVDDRLRMHGMEGLRVVDASIFPVVPCANTNFPTLMTAEKIAAGMTA